MILTIGIVADNYKLEKFKKELTANDFIDYTIHPFTKDTSTIKVNVDSKHLNDVKKICHRVEFYFKRSN